MNNPNKSKQTKTQILILIIGLSILIGTIGFTISQFPNNINHIAVQMYSYGFIIGLASGLIMLLINGTLIKTRYFKFILVLMGSVLIGVLLFLFSSLYGRVFILIGMIGIQIIYFASFLNKPTKKILDYLKVIWVLLSCTISLCTIFDLIEQQYSLITNFLLWFIILFFIIIEIKNKTLFSKSLL